MKRSGIYLLRMFVTMLTGLVLILCVLLARLVIAPVDLEFARDTISEQAAIILPEWDIRFGAVKLGWDWQGIRPWIRIQDLRFIDRKDRLTVELPMAKVGTSFAALWGSIEISFFEIENARINITDITGFSDGSDDGVWSDLFADTGAPSVRLLKPLTAGFNQFSDRLLAQAPKFQDLFISNAVIEIYRGTELAPGRLDVSSLRLQRLNDNLSLVGQVETSLASIPTRAQVSVATRKDLGSLELVLGFNQLVPKDLVSYLELPEQLEYVDFPVSLNVTIESDATLGLKSARFNVQFDEGRIYYPGIYDEPASVQYGLINAHYIRGEERFNFDQIELLLDGPMVEATGSIYWSPDVETPGFRFDADLDEATIDSVMRYWPIARHPDGTPRGARAWVSKHMIGGMAHDVRFSLDIPPDGESTLKERSLYELNFDFDNIDTHFLVTLPPVRGAKGRAVLTEKTMIIDIDSGSIIGMPVGPSRVRLANIDSKFESEGTVNLQLEGNVRDILGLIDRKPLNIPTNANLDIERFDGYAKVSGEFTLPLYGKIGPSSVEYEVNANLTDVKVRDILGGEGVTDGLATMHIVPTRITAEGVAKLNGVPAEFVWEEDLLVGKTDPEAMTTFLKVAGFADEEQLKALSIDIADFMQGPAQFDADLFGRGFKFETANFSADLEDTVLQIPQLGWQKPVAVSARASGDVVFDGAEISILPLTLTGEEIDAAGDFRWQSDGFTAQFRAKKLGANSFTADMILPKDGTSRVDITADQLDLRPYFNLDKQNREAIAGRDNAEDVLQTVVDTKPAEEKSGNIGEVLEMSIKANRALLLNGETLTDMVFKGSIIDGAPYDIFVTSMLDDVPIALSLKPVSPTLRTPTEQRLHIETNNAGGLVRGVGIFPHLIGGTLDFDIASRGWATSWAMDGTITVSDVKLANKATLGEDVTEGLIEGLEEYVDDEGLALDRIKVPFSYHDSLLDLDGLKANGSSLGLTMEGQIETSVGKINVNGVVVPAYGINSFLGKIPLLGTILTGGDGKGVFAFAYRIKGATDDPVVDFSAASGFAPGFLRGIFEGRKGKVSDVELPGDKAQNEADKPEEDKGGR